MFRQDRTNQSTAVSNWRGNRSTPKAWPSTATSTWLNGGLFGAGAFVAFGGLITQYVDSGDSKTYRVHTFRGDGKFYVVSGSADVDVLVVAGGGSSGGYSSGTDTGGRGGGGGGGLRTDTVTATAQTYTIVVGKGGDGWVSGAANGFDGADSSALGISCTGGGRGGSTGGGTQAGNIGGSGGGAGGQSGSAGTAGAGNEGSYSPVEGYAGGASVTSGPAGGAGGGAGGVGETGGTDGTGEGGDGGAAASGIQGSLQATRDFGGGGGGGGFNGDGNSNSGYGAIPNTGYGGMGHKTNTLIGTHGMADSFGGGGIVILRYDTGIT